MSALSVYRTFLSRRKHPFPCPDCGDLILPKTYQNHCQGLHSINSLTCVWCRQYTWQSGCKGQSVTIHHLLHCSKIFLATVPKPTAQSIQLLDFHHEARAHYVYNNIPFTPPESALIHLPPIRSLPLTFTDDALNAAASYLLTYLENHTTHDWMHVMVRRVAYDTFLEALKEDAGITRILPFACWCNGGGYKEARHRHHFHAIVYAPKDHFESKVWSQVQVAKQDRPKGLFKCKKQKPIECPLHLVNALGYMSHQSSRCEFSTKREQKSRKLHHFYIFMSLPKQFALPLSLLWEGGLYEHLHEKQFQNVSQESIAQAPMELGEDGRYRQKIKHFYKPLDSRRVIPVSPHFLPTTRDRVTESFFYLMNGQKLYFERCSTETLDLATWLERQVAGGNCFLEAVQEAYWTPRMRDQTFLRIHVPVLEKCRRVEAELAEVKTALGEERRTHKRKLANVEKDNRVKIEHMQEKIARLEKNEWLWGELETARRQIEQYKERIKHLERQ